MSSGGDLDDLEARVEARTSVLVREPESGAPPRHRHLLLEVRRQPG